MGRLQQLRAEALSLRGALAMGGAVVVAASMTQVVGTLAAPNEVRTAKLGTSTQNYFPTPLPNKDASGFNGVGIHCDSAYEFPANVARVSWPSVGAGYKYYVTEQRVNSAGAITYSESQWTTATSLAFNYAWIAGVTTQIRVYVVNIASGPTDATRVRSSGHVGTNIYTVTGSNTRCTNPKDYYRVDNAIWENQSTWNPTMVPFAVSPTMPLFTTLMDTLNSEETLDPLPEETELADLEAAARPALTPTDEAKPTESTTSTTSPGTTSPSDEAAPETSASSSTSTAPSSIAPSTSATSTSGTTKPSTTKTSPRALPTTPLTTASATGTTTVGAQATSTPPASTTTTTATTVRAGVGEGPIRVGEVFARLDEVDGQPRLVVMGDAGGGEVCTADVPGATRIQSSDGGLTVTVEGRTRAVDLATCEVG